MQDSTYEGKPCRDCGNTLRYSSNRACVACISGDGSRLAAKVARDVARRQGKTTWTRYTPCPSCGTHERYTTNSGCVECARRRSAAAYVARPPVSRAPSPRDLAISEGSPRYTAVKPCRRCGGTERYTSSGGCCGCMRRINAARREATLTRYANPAGDRVLWVERPASAEYAALYRLAGLDGWHCVFSSAAGRSAGKDVLSNPGKFMSLPESTEYERLAVQRIGAEVLGRAIAAYNLRGHREK